MVSARQAGRRQAVVIETASEEGPRGAKTYAITDAGRHEFSPWMLAELIGRDLDVPVLSRTYFLGLMDASERLKIATNIAHRMQSDLDQLERIEAQIDGAIIPEGLEDVAKSQPATLQYGLAAHRTALAWVAEYFPKH